ncbi:MAG: hypothetical protein AAGC47_01375 [Bacteroidota bacterium]
MRSFLCIAAFFVAVFGYSQTLQDWMRLGDEAMERNDPYGALRYYENGMRLDSMKGSLIYSIAEAYREVQNYEKAVYYYNKIYRRDRGMIFKDTGIKLAEMQMQLGKYSDAKLNWRRMRDEHRENPNSYEYQKAIQSMRSCDLAKQWTVENPSFMLSDAGDPVNSGDSEFGGIWNDDGSFSFTSLRGRYDEKGRLESEIYFIKTYRADSTLKEVSPEDISSIELSQNYGNYVQSSKGQKAVVQIDERGHRSIHFHDGLKWQQILPASKTDTANYTHPAFGRIGKIDVLFFSSDRPDSYGNYDLWYVELTKPSDPVNLGPDINTPGNEVTPFFRKDQDALYFSSDWHHGLGGYDIFKVDYFEGSFSFPENLRPPFSSSANDLYYSFNSYTRRGSVTSNRVFADRFGGCCNNLYLFEEEEIVEADTLPEIASLEDLNKYLPVTLYFHNDEPDPRTRNTETDLDYLDTYRAYTRLLPTYQEEYKAGLNTSGQVEAEESMDDFFLNEIDQGVSDLSLFSELLFRELEEGAQIEMTVRGFASPLAATDYNVNLTQRRISSLINYLKNYKRGKLRPYLNGSESAEGRLRIVKVPFGEYVAQEKISDNPNESNAIYGIAASRERKIEIVSVTKALNDTNLTQVNFESEIIDLGLVEANGNVEFTFNFEVVNAKSFSLDSTSTSENLEVDFSPSYSQGSQSFSGMIFINNESGKQNKTIEIFGNLVGLKKQLNITYEVKEN